MANIIYDITSFFAGTNDIPTIILSLLVLFFSAKFLKWFFEVL